MRIFFLLFGCMVFFTDGYGQQFGGIPSSIKWQQVNTPEARIIFPRGLEKQAFSAADIIRYADSATAATIGSSRKKINIVFQNQTTVSNGFVALAPWRSEFFLTPQLNSFQLGSLPWVKSLALHEYRHVQQYMNFRKGLSKVAYMILGEEGQAVANSASIPDWFFEGDAVFQETLLSGQGRGRMPAFFNDYRALWAANRNYSFMKLRNGSMKHFVPDHYALGYLLTGYGREKFGSRFWADVTNDAARFKGLFYPFQRGVKKYSGMRYKTFVQNALHYYKDYPEARVNANGNKLQDNHYLTPARRYVSNYNFPCFAGKDSILVLKSTFRDIPAWYWLVNGKEYRIRTKDIGLDDYYSYSNGRIAYTAYEPDARWGQRNYSVVKVLDIRTQQVKTITYRSKYFSPDISADGKIVVAVQYLPDQSAELHILDAESGVLQKKIPVADTGLVYTYPKFYNNENIITCIRNDEGMMNLAMVNIHTGLVENLSSWSYGIKGYPVVRGDTVYFSASIGYFDDVYAIDIRTRNLFRLTHETTGGYQATVNEEGRLVWSNFTADGYRLKEKQLTPEDWQPLMSVMSVRSADLYLPDALRQGGNILNVLPQGDYAVKRYRKISAPFNFHSWRPYYEQPEWSLYLYGQNILNSFRSTLYYTYNENESSHTAGFDAMLGAWYPWITGGASYALNRNAVSNNRRITWNELNLSLGAQLPFDLTKGRWHKNLTIAGSFNVLQQTVTGAYKDSVATSPFQYLQASAGWSSQVQTAVQHIYPRLAQSFFIRYRRSVSAYTAGQFLATGSLYLPGIAKTNSLVLTGAYQERDTANEYRFSNSFPFARGYTDVESRQMFKWGVNYHFPLFYPDWGFANLLYFSRIRANLFFDYAYVRNRVFHDLDSYRSMGGELFFDTKWWNQQPASFGFRFSYLPDHFRAGLTTPYRIEFVLPVSLISP